jgi:2-dehydro-3-deoxygalactonokinase
MQEEYILCCDWGTTSFRLRLASINGEVLSEINSEKGILFFYNDWLKKNNKDTEHRFRFFLQYIQSQTGLLQPPLKLDLTTLPIVISGMAISSIGMMNMPYEGLPFSVNGTSGFTCQFQENGAPVILITGVSGGDDLMRGEETQIVGLFHTPELNSSLPQNGIFILPGTHSKHVTIADANIISIKTFMTGELFSILMENGTLSKSIQFIHSDKNEDPINTAAFIKGIHASKSGSLLHSLFQIRVNDILAKSSKEENFYYLSGLLIGSEFNYLIDNPVLSKLNKLIICCTQYFIPYYKTVLKELGLYEEAIFIDPSLFDKATVLGQLTVYKKYIQSNHS